MKTIMLGMMVLGLAGNVLAVDRVQLDNRIRDLTLRFEEMQANPATAVPADLLKKAQGVILLGRTKAGFLFAFEGGGGVAMARDPKTSKWSPVAFIGASEASLGFQVGGEQSFYAILLMDDTAVHQFTRSADEYGSEARGTAGEASSGVASKLPRTQGSILVFGDHQGLFAGADISAGRIEPDNRANVIYYGQAVTMDDILFHGKVQATEPAQSLAQKIQEQSRGTVVSSNTRR